MVEKINFWSWADDDRIRNEFEKLNLIEILILIFGVALVPFLEVIGFVFGFDHDPSSMVLGLEKFFWWATFFIVIVHTGIFRIEIHWPPSWQKKFSEADFRMLLILFFVTGIYVVLVFWPGVANILFVKMNLIVGDKKIYFLKIWIGFLSVLEQELEFRLILYYSLNRIFGRHAAFFGSSLFFGFWHEADLFYRMATFSGGAIFSTITIATGSVIPAIILHSAINFSALLLAIALQ